MNQFSEGYLSKYYVSVAAKRLTSVEIDQEKSNQHEFNGSKALKEVFGLEQPQNISAQFIWLGEGDLARVDDGSLTWYDSRVNHPTRSEYRLYFKENDVTIKAKEGDSVFVAKKANGDFQLILVEGNSYFERQLFWLFGLAELNQSTFVLSDIESERKEIGFVVRQILDELDNEVLDPEPELIDQLLLPFKGEFPKTREFSIFARNTIPFKLDPLADPDEALVKYMDWEERLFRRLERVNIMDRIEKGFLNSGQVDVDSFISFSMSVQNRRKSRAGLAFEDHIAFVLSANEVKFDQRVSTELKSKPDFVFPGLKEYLDEFFPVSKLVVLGAKTSCKDRWRQVISEAKRIERKHLITLEPGISDAQIGEMVVNKVQIVVPHSIHESYNGAQRSKLLSFKAFIKETKSLQ